MTSGSGYGYGVPPGHRWVTSAEYGRMRACDADRERTADLLRSAFVEGRLSQDELDERLGRVYAGQTYSDLAAQTSDLPVQGRLPAMPSPYPPPVPFAPASTNGMAIGSFVCGVLEMFTLGLTAVPAVILGHSARRQIRETGQRGDGLALTGLIFGWLGIGMFTLILIGVITTAVVGTSGSPATGSGNSGTGQSQQQAPPPPAVP